MGDGGKASLQLQFNPQSGWSSMVPPSPATPDCWPSENWMTPWNLPPTPPTISRKAVLAVISVYGRESHVQGNQFDLGNTSLVVVDLMV